MITEIITGITQIVMLPFIIGLFIAMNPITWFILIIGSLSRCHCHNKCNH